jgi:regulator of nucleoside diphosphate kinase
MADAPQICLTQPDMDRLLHLIEADPGKRFDKLESELLRAKVVPREEIPPDVVTMNSRVLFENETTGERREVTLVYPGMADIDAGKISVLVPVGTALLGLRVGQSIDWELPSGTGSATALSAFPTSRKRPASRGDARRAGVTRAEAR